MAVIRLADTGEEGEDTEEAGTAEAGTVVDTGILIRMRLIMGMVLRRGMVVVAMGREEEGVGETGVELGRVIGTFRG